MLIKRVLLTALLTSALGWAGVANALPIVHLTPDVIGGFEPDAFPPQAIPGFDPAVDHGSPVLVQIGFYMEITDLDPSASPSELGFANVAFGIDHAGVGRAPPVFPSTLQGWIANNPQVDHDGDGGLFTPDVGTYTSNSDEGPDKTDLREIIVEGPTSNFGDPAFDTRIENGQNGPVLVGSAFFLWDGFGPDFVSSVLGNPPGSYYDAEGTAFDTPNGMAGQVQLGVPEPTTCVLLGLGSVLMMVIRRKRS